VIDSFVEVLFSNSLRVITAAVGFGLFFGFFRNRYQHVVVVLTASADIKFEYPNFRLFPDFLIKKTHLFDLDWQLLWLNPQAVRGRAQGCNCRSKMEPGASSEKNLLDKPAQPAGPQSLTSPQLCAVCFATWFCGAAATLTGKGMFQTEVKSGKLFNKPLTSSFIVSAAMASSLVVWLLDRGTTNRQAENGEPLLKHKPSLMWRVSVSAVTLLPLCLMDLGTTISINIAQIHAPASIVQMIGSSGLAFTAVLTHIFLGTRYTRKQWFGVLLAIVGLLCTASSELLLQANQQPNLKGASFLGVGMALLGTTLTCSQWVIEEKFLKEARFVPLQQVGIEGLLEVVLLLALVLPLCNTLHGSDNGRVEDVFQGVSQITSSSVLSGLAFGLWASLAAYNPLSQTIARNSGSVLRMFMSITRSMGVWTGGLILFHFTDGQYGETWHKYSSLQLVGFLFISAGLVAFNT
jgi:drug/metabolite transporter (DMT)-like permease